MTQNLNGRALSAEQMFSAEERGMMDTVAELAGALAGAEKGLCNARAYETRLSRRRAEAKEALDVALDAAVIECDYMARVAKEGPLAGLAKTSDTYKAAVRVLRDEARHDTAADEYEDWFDADRNHMEAAIALHRASDHFKRLLVACEMQSSLLRFLGRK